MGAGSYSIDSESPSTLSGSLMAGLVGRLPYPRGGGRAVCERLELFVAPIAEEEPKDIPEVAWIRLHNAKVRESVKGSGSLAQRLSGESEESELSHQWAQSSGGEALNAKMLELRMRRRALA